MKQELSDQVSVPDVRNVLREKFESIFGVQIVASSIATLRDTLETPYTKYQTLIKT
jgi:hypothetical protein